MSGIVDDLLEAMSRSAAHRYGGEAVSELDHALQCAELAATGGADEELVLACLLHDVGRYFVDQSLVADTTEAIVVSGQRGHHAVGRDVIAPWVPPRVAWCVGAHADAKRYLCAIEPAYYERLSAVSRRTLVLQGGVMSAAETETFVGEPWAADAVALRRWDDEAKVAGKPTPGLAAWEPLMRRYFAATPRHPR
ncbi:MAG TPA: HD domain-containing protein [Methylomirabilota bacterium]|jgi:predicted HD phosphohydrolase